MTFAPFTRRQFLQGSAAAVFSTPLASVSLAANPSGVKLHGLSSFGDLKYPADFRQFDYGTPDAPKGGTFAFSPSYWYFNQNTQTFNTLNSFVLRGQAPPRMELCFDYLMEWAMDEPDALYCALAKSVEITADRNCYRFELHPQARFHDGSGLTAHDVAFSYRIIKEKGHPQLSQDLRNLDEAVALSDTIVELRFNGKQSDRAVLAVANTVPVLSRQFYANRSFDASTLEMPLASGPYIIERLKGGSFVEYTRVADYWARDLPFARGINHFGRLRIEFFRERTAAFEAFKKGVINWREEFTSKVWATEYDFPAVNDGRVKRKLFTSESRPALQGWAINSRRQRFNDPRTREAISLCFDFKWTNKNMFYGAYTRSQSIFEKSEFRAEGTPSEEEYQLLEPWRDQLPQSVFGLPFTQFESDGSGSDRRALKKALNLLRETGWRRENGRMVDQNGEVLALEILIRAPVFERVLGKYIENLKKIGIEAAIRLVDPSQFQARIDAFDFDMVGIAVSLGASPTAESMRQFLHSESANRPGSYNYPGISSPVLDHLIEKLQSVGSRDELIIVLRTIDRVLRPMHLWIPNWYAANHRVAYWDMFGWKDPKPDYFFPVEKLWWFDAKKARAIGKA